MRCFKRYVGDKTSPKRDILKEGKIAQSKLLKEGKIARSKLLKAMKKGVLPEESIELYRAMKRAGLDI